MVARTQFGKRILDSGGPIVVWDDPAAGKRRRGLLFETSVCDNRRCAAVHLRGHVLEESEDNRSTPLVARFDTASGRVVTDEEASPVEDRLLRLIDSGEGNSLPQILRRRWRHAKGLDDRSGWRSHDWSWWEPGTLVAHCEVFPDAPDILFQGDGRDFWARDHYCINPKCDCHDVVLSFFVVGDSNGSPLGDVTVDCGAWETKEFVPVTGSEAELRALWLALDRVEDLRETVLGRHEELREIGPELAARAAAGAPEKDLSPEEIIDELTLIVGPLPRRVLEAAIARRDEMTPLLLEVLEKTIANPEDPAYLDSFVHLSACFLLAQFRERQAYPLMIRLASLPEDLVEPLLEDFTTEDLPRAFASVAHGDPGPVMRLARDRAVFVWSRVAALESLVVMVAAGELDRARAIELLREFAREILAEARTERFDERAIYWMLVSCACDLFPEELQDEIDELFERDLVDRTFINPQHVAAVRRRGMEATLALTARANSLITDSIGELEAWAFREEDDDLDDPGDGWGDGSGDGVDSHFPDRRELFALDDDRSAPVETIIRDAPKVGRNDPCPCGSGKKYKRCCLNK